MTVKEMVMKRTGMSSEDADFYIAMAQERVRSYLHLEPEADLSKYDFQIADISTLYWQKDQATYQAKGTLGYNRESFQEGNVRHTIANMTGEAIFSSYDSAILSVLETLDGSSGNVIFL